MSRTRQLPVMPFIRRPSIYLLQPLQRPEQPALPTDQLGELVANHAQQPAQLCQIAVADRRSAPGHAGHTTDRTARANGMSCGPAGARRPSEPGTPPGSGGQRGKEIKSESPPYGKGPKAPAARVATIHP